MTSKRRNSAIWAQLIQGCRNLVIRATTRRPATTHGDSYIPNPHEACETRQRRTYFFGFGLFAVAALILIIVGCRPDLTVEPIDLTVFQTIDCTTIVSGEGAVDIVVHNHGRRRAGLFTVALNDQTQTVDGLAAGDKATLTFAIGDATRLTVTADAAGDIGELDERNNRQMLTVAVNNRVDGVLCSTTPEVPDLAISAECIDDSRGEYRITAENRSQNDIYGTIVVDINGVPYSLSRLQANETKVLLDGAWTGRDTVTAIVDRYGQIDERSEENNRITVSLAECVPTPVEAAEAELSVHLDAECVAPDLVQVDAWVVNSGAAVSERFALDMPGRDRHWLSGADAGAVERYRYYLSMSDASSAALKTDGEPMQFEAFVDATGMVVEASETNNRKTAEMVIDPVKCDASAELPDLTITVSAAATACVGESAERAVATVRVQNQGEAQAGAFTVAVGDHRERVDGLDAGATHEFTYTVEDVNESIIATVDSENEIEEVDETNNGGVAGVETTFVDDATCHEDELEAQANLSVYTRCEVEADGQSVRLYVEARNSGPDAVGPFQTTLNDVTFTSNGLAAGAPPARFEHVFPAGHVNFIAVVDSGGAIAETNESDNQSTLDVRHAANAHCRPPQPDVCMRFDFELGREAVSGMPEAGWLDLIEAHSGRVLTSWWAEAGWLDSGWVYTQPTMFDAVHVDVVFRSADGGAPVALEILNHAPNSTSGWVARDGCHAVELQFPTGW